jgi:DNA-binding transcriptional regulator YiaG
MKVVSKKKRMADGLLEGLKQAAQMERKEVTGRERTRTLSRPAPKWSKQEIKRIRTEHFQMSQPAFAALLNVKVATVRAWEQGQRIPDGAASRLLQVLLFSESSSIPEKLAS